MNKKNEKERENNETISNLTIIRNSSHSIHGGRCIICASSELESDNPTTGLAGTYRGERTSGGVELGRLLPAARTLAIVPTDMDEEMPVGVPGIGSSSNNAKWTGLSEGDRGDSISSRGASGIPLMGSSSTICRGLSDSLSTSDGTADPEARARHSDREIEVRCSLVVVVSIVGSTSERELCIKNAIVTGFKCGFLWAIC